MLTNIKTSAELLQEAKDAKRLLVNTIRKATLNSDTATTVTPDLREWKTNPESMSALNEAITLFSAIGAVPNGYVWRDVSNVNHPADLQLLIDIASAKATEINTVWQASWTLKNQIDACTTKEELDAIVIPDTL